jgi:hypothetical protein
MFIYGFGRDTILCISVMCNKDAKYCVSTLKCLLYICDCFNKDHCHFSLLFEMT